MPITSGNVVWIYRPVRVLFLWVKWYSSFQQLAYGELSVYASLKFPRVDALIGVARGGERGHDPPKCLENQVILYFKRRFSKQNNVIRLESNILTPKCFGPHQIFWLVTPPDALCIVPIRLPRCVASFCLEPPVVDSWWWRLSRSFRMDPSASI